MRKLIAAALILLSASTARAQTMGVRIGPTFNNFKIKQSTTLPALKTDQYAAYGVGVSFIWGKSPIKLQADGHYLTRGARFPETSTDTIEVRHKLNYIELTPAVRFEVKNGPFVYAGPYGAVEGQCLSVIKGGSLTVESDCNAGNVYFPHRHKLDYGLVGGAGWSYGLGKGGKRVVSLEARYAAGMRNINSDDRDDAEVRNRTFSIMLGYATKK